jgi:hypothetical protein
MGGAEGGGRCHSQCHSRSTSHLCVAHPVTERPMQSAAPVPATHATDRDAWTQAEVYQIGLGSLRNRQVIGSSPIVGSRISSTSTTPPAAAARLVAALSKASIQCLSPRGSQCT